MVTKELSEAAVEFNIILDYSSEEIIQKIPIKFRNFMKKIEAPNYRFDYDKSKKLIEQDLKPETRGLIALVYQNYICTENERADYLKKCEEFNKKKEDELKEKYNPENLFKKEKIEILNNDTNEYAVLEYKETFFTKIRNKIIKFFKQ